MLVGVGVCIWAIHSAPFRFVVFSFENWKSSICYWLCQCVMYLFSSWFQWDSVAMGFLLCLAKGTDATDASLRHLWRCIVFISHWESNFQWNTAWVESTQYMQRANGDTARGILFTLCELIGNVENNEYARTEIDWVRKQRLNEVIDN